MLYHLRLRATDKQLMDTDKLSSFYRATDLRGGGTLLHAWFTSIPTKATPNETVVSCQRL